jgi:hypothetical protein
MRFLCSIHNVTFDISETPKEGYFECPLCMRDELVKLREDYRIVKKQRDVLVEAIGVVKTVQELK